MSTNSDPTLLTKIVNFSPEILSFLLGFMIAIFAEPFRRFLFKPVLKLSFGKDDDYISYTPTSTETQLVSKAYYIRVKVTNKRKSIAKDCKAFLINIEKQGANNTFKPTVYCDSIQLAWACQGKDDSYNALDITKGVNQFVDVIALNKDSNIFEPKILTKPFRYLNLFKETGSFLFTVQVSADGANPVYIKLLFKWNGSWNNFEVYEYEK